MAEAITNAVNQLENRQTELASKLGMSKGTLSKWFSIGSSNSLISVKQFAPTSFDSLYQLSALDNQYKKYYGEEKGSKNFFKLFENKNITSYSQRKDIIKFVKLHKGRINIKENINVEKPYEQKISSEIKLNVLVKSKLFFNVTGDWTEIKTTGLDLDKWSNAYALHMGASTRITRNVKLLSGTMIYGKVNDPNGESDDSYIKSTFGGFYGAVQFRF